MLSETRVLKMTTLVRLQMYLIYRFKCFKACFSKVDRTNELSTKIEQILA